MDGVFMKKLIKILLCLALLISVVFFADIYRDKKALQENLVRLHVVANSDSATAEVALSGMKPVEAGGYIKVFIWKDDNLSPQTNVTYVK